MSEHGTTALHFEPPGPGSWNLDPVHFPRPVTRYLVGDSARALPPWRAEFMAYLGTLIDTMETQYVNGFAYNAMRPAPENEIPERFARAEVVWEAEGLARAVARVGRNRQTHSDQDSPRTAVC